MTESQITKRWREKGQVLRSIIHGTVLFKFKLKSKSFGADDKHKVHDNNDQCIINNDDDKKQLFCKVGLLPSLVRVPSRGLKRIGRAVSMRKHEGFVKDEGDSLELCKKRIIMGKKCRTLNVSGALHYDKNGVLVPEDYCLSPSISHHPLF